MNRLAGAAERALAGLLDWAALSWWRGAIVVGLLALAVILPGLSAMPVTDRDEARFAQATKQMLETGDLIDIRFQDQPRWKKPVGIYWLQAASASLLGDGPRSEIWAYRIPSALAVLFASILTVWTARPLIGARAAVLAGLMMATTLLAVAEAHIAKTDAALMLTAVAALGALARMKEAGPGTALAFWIAIAAAILLKGPIVPVVVALALGWVWCFAARPPFARLRPLPGLALTAALVLPWLVAIWIVSDGAFFAESVGKDMLGKVAEGKEKHWGPPGLYLALVWLTLWPWAALLPSALPALWRERRAWWLVLLAGWVLPFWLVLELVPTKLPHYVLPLYPALVIALAWWAVQDAETARWQRRLSAVLLVLPVALVALLILTTPFTAFWLSGAVNFPAMALAVLALVAAVVGARAALSGRRLAQASASLIAALILYPTLLQFQIPSVRPAFPSQAFAERWANFAPCARGPLISLGYREPSLAFLAGTETQMLSPWAITGWRDMPDTAFLLETRYMDGMEERAPEFFEEMVPRDWVPWYFNYNRGKGSEAIIYTSRDPRWEACVQ